MNSRWTFFWSEYMVWSLRACCFCASVYFFSGLRESLHALTGSMYSLEVALSAITIASFMLSQKIFPSIYKPKFYLDEEITDKALLPEEAIILNRSEYTYRVYGETVIGVSVLALLINLFLAIVCTMLIGSTHFEPMLKGFGLGAACFISILIATALLVAEGTDGKNSLFLQAIGLLIMSFPTIFILKTISDLGSV